MELVSVVWKGLFVIGYNSSRTISEGQGSGSVGTCVPGFAHSLSTIYMTSLCFHLPRWAGKLLPPGAALNLVWLVSLECCGEYQCNLIVKEKNAVRLCMLSSSCCFGCFSYACAWQESSEHPISAHPSEEYFSPYETCGKGFYSNRCWILHAETQSVSPCLHGSNQCVHKEKHQELPSWAHLL